MKQALARSRDVAIDDGPSVGRYDAQRDRIGLVAVDVHEERRAVPVRVHHVEHGEGPGHRGIGEYAIADAHTASASRKYPPVRAVGLVPAYGRTVARRHREILHVAGEIHARISAG